MCSKKLQWNQTANLSYSANIETDSRIQTLIVKSASFGRFVQLTRKINFNDKMNRGT